MELIHLKMEKPRILTPKITYFSKFVWEDNDQTHTLRSAIAVFIKIALKTALTSVSYGYPN